MSDTTTPITLAFDLQRNAINQAQEAFESGIEAQQKFGNTFGQLEPVRHTNAQAYESLRAGVAAYFDLVDSMTPGDQRIVAEFHTAVDEQLETIEGAQAGTIEAIETNVGEGNAAIDELLYGVTSSADGQFEAVRTALDELEVQLVEAVENFEANMEEMQAEFETQVAEIEAQVDEAPVGAVEQSTEHLESSADLHNESLESLHGVGPMYAQRLQDAGIDSLESLADSTVEMIVAATDVSENQAQDWIDDATSQA